VAEPEGEEKLLRSAALQTANSIFLIRQRAEQELIQAKEALERKTEELAHLITTVASLPGRSIPKNTQPELDIG